MVGGFLVGAIAFAMVADARSVGPAAQTQEVASPVTREEPRCYGVEGEYGCYDKRWCYEQLVDLWTPVLGDSGPPYSPYGDWAEWTLFYFSSSYSGRPREMGMSASRTVYLYAIQEGESQAISIAERLAAGYCADEEFLRATVDLQLASE